MDLIAEAVSNIHKTLPGLNVLLDEPMKKHTTLGIGGPVRVMCFPETASCMIQLCKILHDMDITPFIMGNGSNLLVTDTKIDIIVINTARLRSIELTETVITAECGILLSELAVFAHKNNLTGLEFAHGIPGSVGGAVVMNAGAYGREMKDVVYNTIVYDAKTGTRVLTAADNEFSYRKSYFSDTDDIVLSAVIRLDKGDRKAIKQKTGELDARRRESQPLELPSAGSTFKRPGEGYAAALIEQAGLRGYSIGGAQVSDKHTGFIVNKGNASFSDTMAVIGHVQEVVFKKFGVQLELEIKVLR